MAPFKSLEAFVKSSKLKYGNEAFDYSASVYQGRRASILLRCQKHPDRVIQTTPEQHLQHGKVYGCRSCAAGKRSNKASIAERLKSIHGSRYTYSNLAEYRTNTDRLSVKCNACGAEFHQMAKEHLRGSGCPQCANARRGKRLSQQDFLDRALSVWGATYDYSQVKYIDYDTPVAIYCKEHHRVFTQRPKKHLQRQSGCAMCSWRGWSMPAILWLDWQAAASNVAIRHALNDGEVSLPGVGKVDGFCQATNTVYEFHGDSWHGNPEVFSMTAVNTANKEYMGVLYLKTLDKEFRIRQAGYNYKETWHRDWLRVTRAIRVIQAGWRRYNSGNRPEKRRRLARKHSPYTCPGLRCPPLTEAQQ